MSFVKQLKKLRDSYVIKQVKNIDLPDFNQSKAVRKRILFTGRVQKVGFRLEVYELAKRLELTGWVRNSDKNVETEIQGDTDKINFLIKFMESLKRASVHDVIINEVSLIEDDQSFTLIKG